MKTLLLALLLIPCFANAVTYVKPDVNTYSYSATTPHFTPPATPTDMCEIFGSATKTIVVTSFEVSSSQSTSGANQFFFIKRSSANTGGTGTSVVPTPFATGYPTATATMKYYSANPTTGSSAGTLFIRRALSAVSSALAIPYFDILDVGTREAFQPIILRGTAEGMVLNFNAFTLPTGLAIGCTIRWNEY